MYHMTCTRLLWGIQCSRVFQRVSCVSLRRLQEEGQAKGTRACEHRTRLPVGRPASAASKPLLLSLQESSSKFHACPYAASKKKGKRKGRRYMIHPRGRMGCTRLLSVTQWMCGASKRASKGSACEINNHRLAIFGGIIICDIMYYSITLYYIILD